MDKQVSEQFKLDMASKVPLCLTAMKGVASSLQLCGVSRGFLVFRVFEVSLNATLIGLELH